MKYFILFFLSLTFGYGEVSFSQDSPRMYGYWRSQGDFESARVRAELQEKVNQVGIDQLNWILDLSQKEFHLQPVLYLPTINLSPRLIGVYHRSEKSALVTVPKTAGHIVRLYLLLQLRSVYHCDSKYLEDILKFVASKGVNLSSRDIDSLAEKSQVVQALAVDYWGYILQSPVPPKITKTEWKYFLHFDSQQSKYEDPGDDVYVDLFKEFLHKK